MCIARVCVRTTRERSAAGEGAHQVFLARGGADSRHRLTQQALGLLLAGTASKSEAIEAKESRCARDAVRICSLRMPASNGNERSGRS